MDGQQSPLSTFSPGQALPKAQAVFVQQLVSAGFFYLEVVNTTLLPASLYASSAAGRHVVMQPGLMAWQPAVDVFGGDMAAAVANMGGVVVQPSSELDMCNKGDGVSPATRITTLIMPGDGDAADMGFPHPFNPNALPGFIYSSCRWVGLPVGYRIDSRSTVYDTRGMVSGVITKAGVNYRPGDSVDNSVKYGYRPRDMLVHLRLGHMTLLNLAPGGRGKPRAQPPDTPAVNLTGQDALYANLTLPLWYIKYNRSAAYDVIAAGHWEQLQAADDAEELAGIVGFEWSPLLTHGSALTNLSGLPLSLLSLSHVTLVIPQQELDLMAWLMDSAHGIQSGHVSTSQPPVPLSAGLLSMLREFAAASQLSTRNTSHLAFGRLVHWGWQGVSVTLTSQAPQGLPPGMTLMDYPADMRYGGERVNGIDYILHRSMGVAAPHVR